MWKNKIYAPNHQPEMNDITIIMINTIIITI